jgi:hypothetical protein
MQAVLKAGVGLALLITVLTVGIVLSGLHENHLQVSQLVVLVLAIGLNVLAVFWGLRQTAPSNGYGRQLLNAVLIGLVGGVLIFCISLLLWTVVFPDYLGEVKASALDVIEASGLSGPVRDAQAQAIESIAPLSQAIQGAIGTVFTSLVAGAIVAIFQRRK